MMERTRTYDEACEKIVADKLDSTFYNHIFSSYRRVNEKDLQVRGVDVIGTYPYNSFPKFYTDEKACTNWIGKNLPTFALSLTNVRRDGKVQLSWFLTPDSLTTHYNFVWVDEGNMETGNIDNYTATLVPKQNIINYLEGLGWTYNNLLNKSQEIRETEGKTEMGNLERNGLKFSYLSKYPEKDVNLLLTRDTLKQLSIFNYTYNGRMENN